MSSNPPSKHSYWLETAVHSALGPPPQLRPKSRLCSVLQTLGISKKPTSVALTVFSGVSNTRVIISGLDWAGKTTLLRNQISLDSTRTGKDIETCAPFIGMLIKTLSYPSSGIIFHAIDIGGAASSSYRQLECAVCAKADAVIWVVDAGDRDRLAESKEEFLRFLNAVAKSEREYLRGEVMVQKVPVVILANKQDLEVCIAFVSQELCQCS
jgi:GTPase SAR1 family protein